jgi:asparagine synthase (glutamine-hydrolysing)
MGVICGFVDLESGETDRTAWVRATTENAVPAGQGNGKVLVAKNRVALGCISEPTSGSGWARAITGADSTFLVVDGCIWNAPRLKTTLRTSAGDVEGKGDAPLALRMYLQTGPDFFCKLDGPLAIAVWDPGRRELLLYRDRLGVKPLYYAVKDQNVAFGSQPASLARSGAYSPSLSAESLYHYMTLLNVPGSETLFEDVFRVRPGCYCRIGMDGNVVQQRYWEAVGSRRGLTESEYAEMLMETQRKAIEDSLRYGGNVGAFLSGGNDSSANVAWLSRVYDRPIHTFTSAIEEYEGQDSQKDVFYARKVADLCGTVHHERMLTQKEFIELVPEACAVLDDMVSEPAVVMLYAGLQSVRDEGLDTVYAGEANDDLLCGHRAMIGTRTLYYDRWLPASRKPRWVRSLVHLALGTLYSLRGSHPGRRAALRRLAADQGMFWSFEMAFVEEEKRKLFTRDFLHSLDSISTYDVVAPLLQRFREAHPDADFLDEIIFVMTQDYFANLMLNKMDRVARHFSIEPRAPYTAYDYVDVALSIPAPMKMEGGHVKAIFKKAIEGLLPKEIVYRKKQGFRTLLPEMCRGRLGDWMEGRVLDSALVKDEAVFDRGYIEGLFRHHRDGVHDFSTRLWTLMTACLWYERWVCGTPTGEPGSAIL